MKKFLTFTTLILASTVLVACSNNKTSSSSSSSKSRTSQSSSSITSSSSDGSSKTTSSSAVQGMNLEQIEAGDYSSIQGTWKSSAGSTITVTGNKLVWKEVNSVAQTFDGLSGSTVTLSPNIVDGSLVFSFQLNTPSNGQTLSDGTITLFPKGVELNSNFGVQTDISKERIFATKGSAGGGSDVILPLIYYKQ